MSNIYSQHGKLLLIFPSVQIQDDIVYQRANCNFFSAPRIHYIKANELPQLAWAPCIREACAGREVGQGNRKNKPHQSFRRSRIADDVLDHVEGLLPRMDIATRNVLYVKVSVHTTASYRSTFRFCDKVDEWVHKTTVFHRLTPRSIYTNLAHLQAP